MRQMLAEHEYTGNTRLAQNDVLPLTTVVVPLKHGSHASNACLKSASPALTGVSEPGTEVCDKRSLVWSCLGYVRPKNVAFSGSALQLQHHISN
jgi:hypothetical protein